MASTALFTCWPPVMRRPPARRSQREIARGKCREIQPRKHLGRWPWALPETSAFRAENRSGSLLVAPCLPAALNPIWRIYSKDQSSKSIHEPTPSRPSLKSYRRRMSWLAYVSPGHKFSHIPARRRSMKNLCSCRFASGLARRVGRGRLARRL